MKGFGERLKALRISDGLTSKELAKELQCGPSSVNYWERDIREPSISALKKICDYFNVSADYMLGRSERK
ncbi:MAG TPA: helix-turn-helix domain-containing protein [Candidatus Borkfalkia excrementigallinarum]|uniref:Helix-turn-helix domain-containing protein n=1 Tax=Candidatus Borkfalkia excrementigallinarum TaxID=2838506 RepID=A0A9D2CS53_9FIRM|nr:helix-turn-helix domain-containing protein [Candidatus Borkfalkia excrementigallinarum]